MGPGDDRVRLRSARAILPEDSEGLITVHTRCKLSLPMELRARRSLERLDVPVQLDDVTVFVTVSDIAPRPVGLVRHIVEIPGNFLNASSYYVNIIVVRDASVGILFQNNVVAFEVAEGEVVGNWYGQTPGAVRPKLQWKSDVVEMDESALSSGGGS